MSDTKRASLFSQVLLIYFVSRVILEAIGILSLFYFPSARAIFPIKDLVYHSPVTPYAEIWARWDSEWYLLVAERGYDSFDYFKEQGGGRYRPTDIAQRFPLYSWAIRLTGYLTGNSTFAGILISNVSALLFLYYFFALATKLLGQENAVQSSLLYILFPTSFFLNAIYAESLFLACLTAAFYYLESKNLLPAAIATFLAVLCRPTGVLAIPGLLILSGFRFPEKKVMAILVIGAAGTISIAIFCWILWDVFGSFAAVLAGSEHWRGQSRYPLYALVRFLSNPVAIHGQHNSFIDFSFAILHLTALVAGIRRIPLPYTVYSAFCLLLPLSSSLFSFARLSLVNFPFFLYLGSQLSGRWALVVQTIFAMLLAFFMAAFANWYWVG